MNEIYNSWSSRSHISSKKVREMKKKALQSYKKISTIKQLSDMEKQISSEKADNDLDKFIHKL